MGATLAAEVMPARRVTLVGLAKNTGKTEALNALAAELVGIGRTLGITSIGRDGEESDVIQPRISKPRIHCPAGTLVATTLPLLSRCSAPYEVLLNTGQRTPLGTVAIGRLRAPAEIEVAGPSTSAGIRAVADAMLDLGAEQVLIDGSIDRRAASAPSVTDAVVLSTGAVLGREIDEVTNRTSRAMALIDLPRVTDRRIRKLTAGEKGDLLITKSGAVSTLPVRFTLTAVPSDIAVVLRPAEDDEPVLVIRGTLPERFLDLLLPIATRHPVRVVVTDATKVFLQTRSPRWYQRRGVHLEVLRRVDLCAITVNPVAPLSHRFDSGGLREAIAQIPSHVPVFDVRSHAYRQAAKHLH